jgi:hypothetical protein
MADDGFERAFLGIASHRDSWARCTVKGNVVRSRPRYLAEHAPSSLATLRARLSPEARRYLDGEVLVTERVPYAPLVEIDREIALVAMHGEVARMRAFAHEIASHDLDGGLYRGLLSMLGGGVSLRLWAVVYQSFFAPGRVTARSEGTTTVVTLSQVMPRYMCMYGFTGYIERLLEIARSPSHVEHRCVHDHALAHCEWHIRARSAE